MLFCTSCIIGTSADSFTWFSSLESSLEMTNGILLLSQSLSHPQVLYPLLLALTSFGGWCSVAQTQSMIAGTGLNFLLI